MFSRVLGIPILLAMAVGVPYLASNAPDLGTLWSDENAPLSGGASARIGMPREQRAKLAPPLRQPGAVLYPISTPLEGASSVSLEEILRFDITKEWVYSRWARKSTALAELGLYGIRVPLVSGTKLYDVAGSLTYYFASDGRVQRISFRGTTGDTTRLVTLVVQRYGLQRQPTPIVGVQLFQVRRDEQVFSELLTKPSSVLWASSPHDSFAVELELQRPNTKTPLASRPTAYSVATAPQQAPSDDAASQTSEQSAEAEATDDNSEAKEETDGWRAFFPRSRVPQEQVDSLNRRSRLW